MILRSTLAFGLMVVVMTVPTGCEKASDFQPPAPPKVTTVQPTVKTIPIFLEENGETEAVEQAVVKARVQGILEEIKFDPDAVVAVGTPLFLIEQKEYLTAELAAKAAVSSAKAALMSTQAAIGVVDAKIVGSEAVIRASQAEFDRQDRLREKKAIAQSEWDAAKAQLDTSIASKQAAVAEKETAKADIENAKAQLEKAEADLAQAELNLAWTEISAPIAGRVNRIIVKRGNLVENGTELVEITANDYIWANFNISERFLLDFERQREASDRDRDEKSKTKVELQRSGDLGFPFEGELDYADPKINQDTGTLTLRAVFNNKDHEKMLVPGLFVRIRVQIGTRENAVMIPERAITRSKTGAFVYVVGADNIAIHKDIVLGPKYENLIVIESGIDGSDTVIVDGIQRTRPGLEVNPQ